LEAEGTDVGLWVVKAVVETNNWWDFGRNSIDNSIEEQLVADNTSREGRDRSVKDSDVRSSCVWMSHTAVYLCCRNFGLGELLELLDWSLGWGNALHLGKLEMSERNVVVSGEGDTCKGSKASSEFH